MPKSDFDEMREMLREIVVIQDQQARVLLRHSEILVGHDERMREIDERLDRVSRHLEVPSTITDDLIRGKADRKKRS